MEFMDLIGLVGEPLDHPKLKQFFREEKINKQPQPAQGDSMAYLQFPSKGYEMRFDLQAGGGPQLLLTSITAYPQGDATHSAMKNELPLSITPTETRDALIARLGAPAFRNKRFNIDMWKLGPLDVVVEYEPDSGVVSTVQVNVPRK